MSAPNSHSAACRPHAPTPGSRRPPRTRCPCRRTSLPGWGFFTRLGLRDDPIASNIAACDAALAQGDIGEALHAMDDVTYAEPQQGRAADGAREVVDLKAMTGLSAAESRNGYAGDAMPVRLAVETRDWAAAPRLIAMPGTGPQITAIVWWARAGRAARPMPGDADADIAQLGGCRDALRVVKDGHWLAQAEALLKYAEAWRFAAVGDWTAVTATMTAAAANEENALEKLPLTPGPIVPAREQPGELLLAAGKPREALAAFDAALAQSPGRLGALRGKAEAQHRIDRQ